MLERFTFYCTFCLTKETETSSCRFFVEDILFRLNAILKTLLSFYFTNPKIKESVCTMPYFIC